MKSAQKRARSKDVKTFAAELSNAYSTARFGGDWSACIRMLRRRGLTDPEIEGVIRSQWPRWASNDLSGIHGKATSRDLARFMDDPRNHCTPEAIADMAVHPPQQSQLAIDEAIKRINLAFANADCIDIEEPEEPEETEDILGISQKALVERLEALEKAQADWRAQLKQIRDRIEFCFGRKI